MVLTELNTCEEEEREKENLSYIFHEQMPEVTSERWMAEGQLRQLPLSITEHTGRETGRQGRLDR